MFDFIPPSDSVARRFLLIFLFTVAATGGCSAPKVNLRPSDQRPDPDDYKAAFKTWSRDISVVPFNGMENVLTARATYLSHPFRQHLVERIAADLHSTPEERAALEQTELAAMKAGHEFYVTLMSAVADCDELTPEEEEGPWTIRLKNDKGVEVAPISVEEVDTPMPRDIKYFFFDHKLRKAYRLIFPLNDDKGAPMLTEGSRFFELSFATAYGRDTVRWETFSK